MRRDRRTAVLALGVSLAANGAVLVFLLVSARSDFSERAAAPFPVLIRLAPPPEPGAPPTARRPVRAPHLARGPAPLVSAPPVADLGRAAAAPPPDLGVPEQVPAEDSRVQRVLQGLLRCGGPGVQDPEAREACERHYLDYSGPAVGPARMNPGARLAYDAAADRQESARAARQGPLATPLVPCTGQPGANLDRACLPAKP